MDSLSERDICSKFITPALEKAGWDLQHQIREEVTFTAGRINIHGKTISRGERKRADYVLYYKNHLPIAIIEAKDGDHSVSAGLSQAVNYAETLDIPFAFSSNGNGFIERDMVNGTEGELSLDGFPSPDELFRRYCEIKDYNEEQKQIVLEDYFEDSSKGPRYYQEIAINKTVEAIAKGEDRLLLVMATGTGKTYTAFQIIYRLWKAKKKKRILFLVDRTALAQQTMQGDFRYFGGAMTKIEGGKVDPAYEIYVSLYQGAVGMSERPTFQQFSRDFFDLIIVDECHRGVAREDAEWRQILEYFDQATQIGLTATPKAAEGANNYEYFGEPVYTYSLKQGIEDGFLAPYKVIRYRFNNDEWRPPEGFVDVNGEIVPDEIYNESMFDRNIIIEGRNQAVAKCVVDFMRQTDPYQKAIIFCVDIAHAERMRQFLVNEFSDKVKEDSRFVVKITGDDLYGKLEIENFINPESRYPVIATTSKLLSTGVDTKTVKLVVLDAPMNSMTEFKQIIGRGTRVEEQYGKYYFTIMDFRNVTRLFADPDFDGEPVKVYEHDGNIAVDVTEQIKEETKSGEEVNVSDPLGEILIDGTEVGEKPKKIRIKDGVDFYPIHRTVQYIDPKTGKLISESLVDYSKKTILSEYASLDDFLTRWHEVDRKDIIVNELLERGVAFEELRQDVGKDLDVFDLVLHVAYGKKPLARSERVKKIKDSDYFTKYEGKAQEIIELLLQKYADQGITAIDDIGDLTVSPFVDYGTVPEIVNGIFGGRDNYLEVIKKIEEGLYNE